MCGKGSQTTTSTSAPNPIAMTAYQNLLTQAGNVASTPFQQYTGEFTAPINQQQQLAGANINQNAGFAQPYIQQAAGYANQAAQPVTAAQIAGFQSPYTQQVVNATQAAFNNQNQQQLENVRGNAAAQGALGGDREGVAEGIVSGQQSAAQSPVIAGLYNQGYNSALSTALQEQQNLGQAAYSLGNLGVAGQNAALSGANAQLGYGTLQQSTQQAQDQALYQQFLAQQGFPFQETQWLAGIDTGVGSQMGGTSSTTGPAPNPLSSLLGLGALGLGAFNASDERVKEDISKVGKTHDGQNLYRYRYKGSPQWHIGLIAQEVEKRHPEAVAGFGGVKYVNLKEATEDAAKRREGGRIPGFQLGGTPYQSSASYIPSMGITMGSGPPKPPGTQGQGQQQTDPLKMASEAMSLEKGIASGGKSLGNLFGSGDVSLDEATQAGAEAGLSPSELGFSDTGADLLGGGLFRKGGGVPGFAGGGLADDAGFSDLGDVPSGGPIGTGMDPEFERRMAALNGLAKPADLPATQGLGLGDIANTTAPGFENNYGIDDSRASWNEAIRQGGDRYQAGQQDAPSLSGVDASNYVNPSVVNGQKQNLTGEIIPPGGFGGGPAPELPPPQDVGDTRPRGLDVSAFAPTPGTAGAPALPSGGGDGERQAGFGGLSALFKPGGNPQLGRALMAAGFAMMASRSPFLANAIGEGGMAGLASYSGSEKAQAEAKKSEASIEDSRKKLEQHADEFAKKLALDTKKMQQAEEHFKAQQEAGKVPPGYERVEGGLRALPGGPADPEAAAKLAQAKKPQNAEAFSGDTIDMMADAIRAGNTQVLTNLGAGAMKADNVAKVWNKVAEKVRAEGGGGADLAAMRANFNAQMQAAKSQAVRAANVEANIEEARQTFPLALDASRAVPRTQFVPLNRAIQMVQAGTSSPELAKFVTANAGVVTAYSQAMARAGVATVDGRHAAESLLSTATSPEAYEAVIHQMEKEMQAAQVAPETVRKGILSRISGRQEQPAGGAPAGGPSGGGRTLTAQDQAALQWANSNPNDPRAAQIKQRLGVQ